MDKKPWAYHADLAEDRLIYVAALLIKARRETLLLYDEPGGDTPWGLGCRAYDRSCSLLIRAAELIPWLSMIDSSLRLVFQIGNVPVRFYRGPADTPRTNTLACSYPELRQLQFAFGVEEPNLLWRFAVETNAIGDINHVAFIGTDERGNVQCSWTMPDLEVDVVLPHVAQENKSAGVELHAPKVGVPGVDKTGTEEREDG